jgi:hypothetical protein
MFKTLTTMTRIFLVFGCKGSVFHIVSGIVVLRKGNGYTCPYCGAEVEDITKTPVGKAYFAQARPDLSPLPHRTRNYP